MNELVLPRRDVASASAAIAIALATIGLGIDGAFHKTPPQPVVDVPHMASAAIPEDAPVRRVASMGRRDMACIASAIWHEAGNQPQEGQIAVAEVVIARTRSGIYPKRPCAVVAQPSQFSFVSKGVVPDVPREHAGEIMRIAEGVVGGTMRSRVKGALWFHATYVHPGWTVPRLGRIGAHIFYGARS